MAREATILLIALVATGGLFVIGLNTNDLNALRLSMSPSITSAPEFVPSEPFLVEDPLGDARDLSVTTLGYGGTCIAACEPILPGVKGPQGDGFDLIGVGLTEDRPDSFVLSLQVAGLQEGFPGLTSNTLSRWVGDYFACWRPAADFAERCVTVEVAPRDAGAIIQSSFHIVGAEVCNDLMWCAWSIPLEVIYGTPGEFRFAVPKAYATFDNAPSSLDMLRASSGWWSTNGAAPRWHAALTAHANGDHQHQHMVLLEPANLADVIDPREVSVGLGDVTNPQETAFDRPLLIASPGSVSGAGGLRDYPELDILGVDFRQEGSDLVAAFQFAGFGEIPEWDFQIAAQFMVRGGVIWNEIGVMQSGGDAYGYAGRCISNGCHDGYLVRVPMEIKSGRPGIIEVRAPRDTWPLIKDGDVTNWLAVYTMYGEGNADVGTTGEPAYGNFHTGYLVDGAIGGIPYIFGSDHVGHFDHIVPSDDSP